MLILVPSYVCPLPPNPHPPARDSAGSPELVSRARPASSIRLQEWPVPLPARPAPATALFWATAATLGSVDQKKKNRSNCCDGSVRTQVILRTSLLKSSQGRPVASQRAAGPSNTHCDRRGPLFGTAACRGDPCHHRYFSALKRMSVLQQYFCPIVVAPLIPRARAWRRPPQVLTAVSYIVINRLSLPPRAVPDAARSASSISSANNAK